jgi:hypothetical protein
LIFKKGERGEEMNEKLFTMYEVVMLAKDIPSHGLEKGTKGTIVQCYTEPKLAYEVEFIDHKGRTTALLTLYTEDLEPIDR